MIDTQTRNPPLDQRPTELIRPDSVALQRAWSGRIQQAPGRTRIGWAGSVVAHHDGLCRVVTSEDAAATAHAGAVDPAYHPATDFAGTRVPAQRSPQPRQADLLRLYEQAVAAWHGRLGRDVVPVFEALHRDVQASYPDEWLLRWNLLESLARLGRDTALETQLVDELHALEIRFASPLEPFRTVEVEILEGVETFEGGPVEPWRLTFSVGR
jgi:hypothetical protein